MGGAASIELSPCLESWKAEAAKEPDDFTDLLTEEALKGEISRLRREIRKQVNMIVSKDDNNLVLDQEINSLLDRAHTVEEWLTPILQNIASLHEECELTGLQFKFKSFHSLKRKVQGVLKTKERQMARNKSKGGGLDIAASVNAVSDALRYTLLVPASSYTETVATLRQTLQESNFSPYHMKNYWSEGDMYQGINDVFTEMDSKLKVEIQYHTPESWQLKSSAHVIYEKFRICSEPVEQQELFAEGVALAASLPLPRGVMDLPNLTKKSAPQLLDAYAMQIVTAGTSVKKWLVEWCMETCPLAKSVEAVIDSEQIIGLELSSLMATTDAELPDVVQSYYDGFKVSVVCSPESYTQVITEMCSKFSSSSPQYLSVEQGKQVRIDIKAARNSYDKAKHAAEDVEGVRLHMVIGSQETSSVYDNILFHIEFYTPDSLETERKVEFLSQMLVTNPSINCVNDEILDLWQACPDPPGALSIQALSAIPDISNVVIHYHYDKDKATSRSVSE